MKVGEEGWMGKVGATAVDALRCEMDDKGWIKVRYL